MKYFLLVLSPKLLCLPGSNTVVRTQSSTALSALTSQVNLIPMQQGGQQYQPIVQFTTSAQPRPVQQRRKSGSQVGGAGGGRKRGHPSSKPSPQ